MRYKSDQVMTWQIYISIKFVTKSNFHLHFLQNYGTVIKTFVGNVLACGVMEMLAKIGENNVFKVYDYFTLNTSCFLNFSSEFCYMNNE